MSNLAEQRQDPPSLSAAHYALIDQIEAVTECIEDIREAQDAWDAFNKAFHYLTPPPEIVAAWDFVKPWLNSHAGATVGELEILQEAERDLMF